MIILPDISSVKIPVPLVSFAAHSSLAAAKRSSNLPKCSSNLPKCSSNLPKCSRNTQLEPFKNRPIGATTSRETLYNFPSEKRASDLSLSPVEIDRPTHQTNVSIASLTRSLPTIKRLLPVFLALWAVPALAEVRLPAIFTDHMVLQQGQKNRVWGWADPAEDVIVTIAGQRHTAKADDKGKWQVTLDSLAVGGPHTLSDRKSVV